MKRILWIAYLLLTGLVLANAQPDYASCTMQPQNKPTTFDSIRYIAAYEYSTFRDTTQPELRDYDEVWLEIGDQITHSFSRPRYICDSIAEVEFSRGADAYSPLHQWCMREGITCLYAHSKISWSYQDLLFAKAYTWMEDIPEMAWELIDSARVIIGHKCQLARLEYRGRRYAAWYAPDIPLPYGPWSFHGLPGLILEIKDDTNRVCFTAKWLQKIRDRRPLVLYAGQYRRVTRARARKLITLMHKHPYIHAGEYAKNFSCDGWGPKLEYKHTWVERE